VALIAGACSGGSNDAKNAGNANPSIATSPAAERMPAGPSCIKPKGGAGCLSLAPASKRVDLIKPVFSNPTSITNPLHPSSRLDQVIYGGQVEGLPFRTEFTRLPETKTITWDGKQIKVVTWQYLAYSEGRINEVALDWFAQDDTGAVWYFGEDVFDYEDGVVSSTDGTWLAGKDGPPGMIMPAKPKVGDVYRSENVPGLVFEEVTVSSTGRSVAGPSGPVNGALGVTELHFDGKREDKIFAPGYGEFSTGSPNSDLEAVSFAIPTDARPGPPPAGLTALSAAIRTTVDRTAKNDWAGAASAITTLRASWQAYRADVPPLLEKQVSRDINLLGTAVTGRDPAEAHQAALRIAQDDLDLQLRYQPVIKIDQARLGLWARQIPIDAADEEVGAVAGDVTTLKWTWDRVRHAVDPAAAGRIDAQIRGLQSLAAKKNIGAVANAIPALQVALAALPG
jgi:hypothetical protein